MGLCAGRTVCAVSWVHFVLLISLSENSAAENVGINPETNRVYNEIVIGGLGIKGEEALYSQWNDTFAVYLSVHVGPKFGVTFRLIYLNFITTYDAVERREVDMVYTNPSVYACLEREYRATPIVSLRNRRKVGDTFYELDRFYGTIFVKADSSITRISEIENRTVGAVSLIGLGACQLQWDELTTRGIQFLSAPRQVRFTSSQQQIVKDVIAGNVDIGMVRTDLAEAMVSDGLIERGSIRVLENLQNRSDDPNFPFPHSTRLAAPEWTLGALPWMNWTISREVSNALMAITPEDPAAVSGKYATWVTPLSYLGMHEMQAKLNWIDGNNKCIRAGDLCETVVCPQGQLKKSCAQIQRGCQDIGEPCPEGHTCLCNPCTPVQDKPILLKPELVVLQRVSGAQVAVNVSQSEACLKMKACLTIQRSDSVVLQVLDQWLAYRQVIGFPAVKKVQYIWFSDPDNSAWRDASPQPGAQDEFRIRLEARVPGSILLRLRTCDASNACLETEDSPFLVSVVEKICEEENFVPAERDAKCVCRTGFKLLEGEFVCVEMANGPEDNMLIIIVSAVLSVFVLAILVGGWVYYVSSHRLDDSWKISLDELHFPDPPVVLGTGTYGQVLLADFRSTPVAVKRVLPRTAAQRDSVSSYEGSSPIGTSVGARASDVHLEEVDPIQRGRSSSDGSAAASRFGYGGVSSTSNRVLRIDLRTKSVESKAAEARFRDIPEEDGGESVARNLTCPAELGRESGYLGERRSSADSLEERGSLSVKQAWSGTGQARASHMQLQVRYQEQDSTGSLLRFPRKPLLPSKLRAAGKSTGKVADMPARRMTGSATTIAPFQLKMLTKEFLQEMQVMVFLRHPNIVTVMGAVVDNKSEPLMVMEHMKHGSLYDLMHNHTMQFDSEITMGVLEGIISGMMYLHSAKPPMLHNDLKSANVLVGLNFSVKLADFGLTMKRKSSGFLGTPFWMAPELLDFGSQPSVKTDVFSFGVTLYELLTRKEPYEEMEDVEEVLDRLGDVELKPPLRPTIPEGLPKDAAAIMHVCWDPDPAARPMFHQIKQMVSELNMKDMESWLNRDSGGAARKRTANQLLYDVFPPHIADTLRQGRKVEPEHHEVVTIFFSDIVGFTEISRALQPMEVMEMLDRLYAKFDTVARKHDIFKVETIGDAYMAVANLVKDQPNHTQLIANFALEAIQTANETMVSYDRPELGRVNIRVGFHAGPVVSSVVGNMNPRFCLFGDTVNTSSRMESHSDKNKIHLSDVAANLLMAQAPSARLTCRGVIPIKGKGDMRTYWLDGFALKDEHRIPELSSIRPNVVQRASLL